LKESVWSRRGHQPVSAARESAPFIDAIPSLSGMPLDVASWGSTRVIAAAGSIGAPGVSPIVFSRARERCRARVSP
jgi:aspartate aminotransferase-like enzyme